MSLEMIGKDCKDYRIVIGAIERRGLEVMKIEFLRSMCRVTFMDEVRNDECDVKLELQKSWLINTSGSVANKNK